jgi:hypothetical protein
MTVTTVTPETLPPIPRFNNRLTGGESTAYRRRIGALGKTQEWAALKIGKKPGPFSRWIRGEFASAPNRKKLDTLLAREEAKVKRTAEPALAGTNGRR